MKQKKSVIKRILVCSIVVLLILLSAISAYIIYNGYHTLSYQKSSLEESFSCQKKPYCGFYEIHCYHLADDSPSDDRLSSDIEKKDEDISLVMVEIDLSRYSYGDITEDGLERLDIALDDWTKAGYQIILRFAYDFDGNAKIKEPQSLDLVLNHVRQVSPVVNKYKDSVYTLQGMFVGNWGEMHGSNYTNIDSLLLILDTMEDSFDDSIFFSVRTPELWREITKNNAPISKKDAYGSSLGSRMGLFNDGLLGSESDLGSYNEGSSPSDIKNHVGKGSRQEEIEFQNQLCLYVPNGGEVVKDNELNDLNNAIDYFSDIHVSYLNNGYDEAVLNKWKNSEYEGINGYEYMADHMGYRYVLLNSDVSEFKGFRHTSTLSVTLNNSGFAPAYKKFTPSFCIVNKATYEKEMVPVRADNRTWIPGEEVTIANDYSFSGYEEGYYDIYFCLKDSATGDEIPCSNSASYNKEVGGYYLGQITIE